MRLSLLGMPGTGKTTLAKIIGDYFEIPVISSGSLARTHGFAGSQAEKEGRLDPDDEKIRGLVRRAVGDSTAYVLDGFPRTLEQAPASWLTLEAVVYLEDTVYNAGKRLIERGRPDDNIDTIAKRMEVYEEYTYPLVDYYREKNLLVTMKVIGTSVEIFTKTIQALNKKGVFEAVISIRELQKELAHERKHSRVNRKTKKKR